MAEAPLPGTLLVLTGPPGAGKTTVSGILTDRWSPGVHLRADDFWHAIRRGRVPPHRAEAHRQNGVVLEAVGRCAAAYARGGYHVVVDGIVGPWFVGHFLRSTGLAPGHVHYVVLRPGPATTLARATGRGAGALTDPAVVRELCRQFADLGRYERHAVDSGGLTPARTAELVEQAVADGTRTLAASDTVASPS